MPYGTFQVIIQDPRSQSSQTDRMIGLKLVSCMHIYSTCTEYTIHVNSNTIHGLTAIDKHLHKLVKHQSINRSNGVNLGI